MRPRRRVMIVVTRTPRLGVRCTRFEPAGLPPRDPALLAARLLALGAEVRVVAQDLERISDRAAAREAKLWRAQLVLLYAGGSFVEDEPLPDERPLKSVARLVRAGVPLLACGPLAVHWGPALLAGVPQLAGALAGPIQPELLAAPPWPGLAGLTQRGGPPVPPAPPCAPSDIDPAWHTLPLDALSPGAPRAIDVLAGASAQAALGRVRHAVHRAGARQITFVDRDLAADRELVRGLASGMLAAAPGVPWSCRVSADHVDPMLAVMLLNGGCRHVVVVSPSPRDAPGLLPMDDPARSAIENAVETLRVSGLPVAVEHVIGRPGHDRDMLWTWARWFRDRSMTVHARVRLASPLSPGAPPADLADARARAGCFDNGLRPRDIVRAVREVTDPARMAVVA